MSLPGAAAAVTSVGMTPLRRLLASAALLCGLLSTTAVAQTSPAVESKPTAAAAEPVNDQAAQDRIMTLVRAGKCGSAKAEATRVGDLSLAEQIGVMCGAHSSNPFPTKKSGGGGGRPGSGGRGGG